MELESILERFGRMCALTPEEAGRQGDLCAAALRQVEGERNGIPGGEEELADYAAAIAARRFVLRCLSTGGVVSIGDPRAERGGALNAAGTMEAEYRQGAARWLRPRGFCFRQAGKEEASIPPGEDDLAGKEGERE